VPDRFLGAFMDWYGDAPDANATLNLFWTARVRAGEPVAADDVAELRWFAPDELPPHDELAFHLLPSVFEAWRSA
jgi:ADP-ribose pyrophosphatase YjhB (NUDIX family)